MKIKNGNDVNETIENDYRKNLLLLIMIKIAMTKVNIVDKVSFEMKREEERTWKLKQINSWMMAYHLSPLNTIFPSSIADSRLSVTLSH